MQSTKNVKSLPLSGLSERMRKRMVGGFNDVEEAVSMSAATSEAKQGPTVTL